MTELETVTSALKFGFSVGADGLIEVRQLEGLNWILEWDFSSWKTPLDSIPHMIFTDPASAASAFVEKRHANRIGREYDRV